MHRPHVFLKHKNEYPPNKKPSKTPLHIDSSIKILMPIEIKLERLKKLSLPQFLLILSNVETDLN